MNISELNIDFLPKTFIDNNKDHFIVRDISNLDKKEIYENSNNKRNHLDEAWKRYFEHEKNQNIKIIYCNVCNIKFLYIIPGLFYEISEKRICLLFSEEIYKIFSLNCNERIVKNILE